MGSILWLTFTILLIAGVRGDDDDDILNSYKVNIVKPVAGDVYMFSEPEFRGLAEKIYVDGCTNVSPSWNDNVNSIDTIGCITAYQGSDCTGGFLILSKEENGNRVSDLAKLGWGDQISSFRNC